MLSSLFNAIHHLAHKLFLARRGAGKPVSAAAMDEAYCSGRWDCFFGPEEQVRYDAIAEALRKLHPSPRILDVGCGSGRLASLLSSAPLTRYVGIDLSSEAIGRAQALGLRDAQFILADFEAWRPEETFDAIVFNESIGYARSPVGVLEAFSDHLTTGGALVVSYFRSGNYAAIWRSIQRRFSVTHECSVYNQDDRAWDIKVLKPFPSA